MSLHLESPSFLDCEFHRPSERDMRTRYYSQLVDTQRRRTTAYTSASSTVRVQRRPSRQRCARESNAHSSLRRRKKCSPTPAGGTGGSRLSGSTTALTKGQMRTTAGRTGNRSWLEEECAALNVDPPNSSVAMRHELVVTRFSHSCFVNIGSAFVDKIVQLISTYHL